MEHFGLWNKSVIRKELVRIANEEKSSPHSYNSIHNSNTQMAASIHLQRIYIFMQLLIISSHQTMPHNNRSHIAIAMHSLYSLLFLPLEWMQEQSEKFPSELYFSLTLQSVHKSFSFFLSIFWTKGQTK